MTDYSNWDTPSGVSANRTEYERLPVDVPYWYWKHGSPNIPQGETGHYGRWNASAEDLDEIMGDQVLADLEIETRAKKGRDGRPTGENYSVYSKRYLAFAVINWRMRWFKNQNTGKNNQHIQALIHLAERRDGVVVPTIPAVLTAKVFAAGELEQCFQRWFAFIRDLKTGKPPQLYYMAVGSFGDTQKFEGSHGTSTLPTLYLPEKDPEKVTFVGDEVAKKMRTLLDEAQPWLNDEAWLKPDSKDQDGESEPEPYNPTSEKTDDIPF